MYCQEIDGGINSVSEIVIQLYEEGQINKAIARRLLNACRKGALLCWGDETAGMKSVIDKGFCGMCMEKSEQLQSIYRGGDFPLEYNNYALNEIRNTVAHLFLCPECREKALARLR